MARFLIERLARRFLSEGTNGSAAACAVLLEQARQERFQDVVFSGMLQALSGQTRDHVPPELERTVIETVRLETANPRAIELALRLNLPGAYQMALQLVTNRGAPEQDRLALIGALGESKTTAAIDTMLSLLADDSPEPIKLGALAALGYFADEQIPAAVLDRFSTLSARTRARSIELLCTRPSWSLKLAESIERKAIAADVVPRDLAQRLRQYDDPRLHKLVERIWGKFRAATPFETQGRITAILQSLSKGKGDAVRGRQYFEKTCANCHKLHGSGSAVGPDLTAAERKNRELLVQNIVDPSAVIRQEFTSHVALTKDGQVLTGLLAESTPDLITLVDVKNQRTVLKRSELEELKESTVSLMPDRLLDDMTDQQIRDLVAYVQSD
jgi:putative heme-binding domain-containing protein